MPIISQLISDKIRISAQAGLTLEVKKLFTIILYSLFVVKDLRNSLSKLMTILNYFLIQFTEVKPYRPYQCSPDFFFSEYSVSYTIKKSQGVELFGF